MKSADLRQTSPMPPAPSWTEDDLPSLVGRRVIVTGANTGLGRHTAEALAARGAAVTMAVRTLSKGEDAAAAIRAAHPAAEVAVMRLDLAELESVRAFASAWSAANPGGLDLLINNAGVMAIPRRRTADGFEMQLGTNHLGHFALTGLLLPALVAVPHSRVVTVSSNAHRAGRMDFGDLMGERRYGRWRAYGQSKLANLLFTGELQRRIDRAGMSIKAMAAHPGFASTDLLVDRQASGGNSLAQRVKDWGSRAFAQPASMGALPTLFAATMPDLPGDTYVGPSGLLEQRGHPVVVGRSAAARNRADAERLWTLSEELTSVTYPFD